LKPKDDSKDNTKFVEVISLIVKYIFFVLKKYLSLTTLSLQVIVRNPTLSSLDFSLSALINNVEGGKSSPTHNRDIQE
jgi:hypothetical protein